MDNDNKQSNPQKVIAGSLDKRLIFGDIEFSCYVLEDETRILGRQDIIRGLSLSRGGHASPVDSAGEMPDFLRQKWLQISISASLRDRAKNPILYKTPAGQTAYGYPAELLVDLCLAIIMAHQDGRTTSRQSAIVRQATVIVLAVAKTGIDALVDEVTGYNQLRIQSLVQRLKLYVTKELQEWEHTFPLEFYEHICRLWDWPDDYKYNRPSVVGAFTNELVYERITAGLPDILERVNPLLPSGSRLYHHHRFLSREYGYPKLREHLSGVIALMRIARTWSGLLILVSQAYPKPNEQLPLPMFDDIIKRGLDD